MAGMMSSSRSPQAAVTQQFGSPVKDIQFIASPTDPSPFANDQTVIDTDTGDAYQVQNFLLGTVVYRFGTMRSFIIGDSANAPQWTIIEGDTLSFDATRAASISFADPLITIDVSDDLADYINDTTQFITVADLIPEVNPNVPDAPVADGNWVLNAASSVWTWVDLFSFDLGDFANAAGFITAADEMDPVFENWRTATIPGQFADAMDQDVSSVGTPTFGDTIINGKLTVTGEIDPTAVDFEQIATPPAPIAGHQKIYFKTDRNAYTFDQDSVEKQLAYIDQVAALPVAIADLGDGSENVSQWLNDSLYIDQGGLTGAAADFVAWDGTDVQPGSWSTIGLSLFLNDMPFVVEAPNDANIYGRQALGWVIMNAFAQALDQDLTMAANVTFASITGDGSPITNILPENVTYTPVDPAAWDDPDPGNIRDAIDRLAAQLVVLGAVPIP